MKLFNYAGVFCGSLVSSAGSSSSEIAETLQQ